MTAAAAVITDIHANLPALQAALARIDELGIERVYCGGDLVGYGPHPDAVCALIAQRGIPTIYGNYDHAIARDHDDDELLREVLTEGPPDPVPLEEEEIAASDLADEPGLELEAGDDALPCDLLARTWDRAQSWWAARRAA